MKIAGATSATSRRGFLQGLAGLAGLAGVLDWSGCRAARRTPRPDVLFISIDDLAPRLGCYGDPIAVTPAFDALAARAVRCDVAWCASPLCHPSRTAVLTGRRPPTTGIYTNQQPFAVNQPDVLTLPRHFARQGYETVAVGKVAHSTEPVGSYFDRGLDAKLPRGERRDCPPLAGLDAAAFAEREEHDDDRGDTGREARGGLPWRWGPTCVPLEETTNYRRAELAARVLAEPRDRPLFLGVGLTVHLPFNPPPEFFALYDPERIPLPAPPADDLADLPPPARRRAALDRRFSGPEEKRACIHAYYASISHVDACLARLLAALDRGARGDRWRNTVVVLWSDHGFVLGEHFVWGKSVLFEGALRVPLLVAWPELAAPGAELAAPVELVALFPTLAELCRLPVPAGLEAVSLLPLLEDPGGAAAHEASRAAFAYVDDPSGTAVRTRRFKYAEWGSPAAAELYDLERDPGELTNLAGRPELAAEQARLSQLLARG